MLNALAVTQILSRIVRGRSSIPFFLLMALHLGWDLDNSAFQFSILSLCHDLDEDVKYVGF